MSYMAYHEQKQEQERNHSKQMTNADRIRAMSDSDLAWEFMSFRFDAFAKAKGCESVRPDTQQRILKWLQQPAEKG